MGKARVLVTVAARIDRLPLYSLHRKLLLVLGVGLFFALYNLYLSILLGIVLLFSFPLSPLQASLLLVSGFLGMLSGALLFGILADRYGRSAMFLLAVSVLSCCTLLAALATDINWQTTLRFLTGVGLGATFPLADIYLSEMLPGYGRGRYTALAYTFGALGVPLATLVGFIIVHIGPFAWIGWQLSLALGACGAPLVCFLSRNLPESPRWYEIQNRSGLAHAALNQMERRAMAECELDSLPAPEDVEVPISRKQSGFSRARALYMQRAIMVWSFQILRAIAYYSFIVLIPFALRREGLDLSAATGYMIFIYAGYPLGSCLSIPLQERYERKWILVIAGLVLCICGLLIAFSMQLLFFLVVSVLLTVVNAIFTTTLHTYQAEIFPTRRRGTAVGIATSMHLLLYTMLPFLATPIFQLYGVGPIFAVSALLLAIACLIVGIWGPTSTGRSLEALAEHS